MYIGIQNLNTCIHVIRIYRPRGPSSYHVPQYMSIIYVIAGQRFFTRRKIIIIVHADWFRKIL